LDASSTRLPQAVQQEMSAADTVAGGIKRDSVDTISNCEDEKRERVANSHLVKYRCARWFLLLWCVAVLALFVRGTF
jgi:hypothetical protein